MFAPIPAPRDWNNEAATIVATYDEGFGPRLHSEDVDQNGYFPYSRRDFVGIPSWAR